MRGIYVAHIGEMQITQAKKRRIRSELRGDFEWLMWQGSFDEFDFGEGQACKVFNFIDGAAF